MDIAAQGARLLDGAVRWRRNSAARLAQEVRLTFDKARWAGAVTWRDRAAAVSWPRAGVMGGLAVAIAGSLWLALDPFGGQPVAPRLPTEQEWRASQAAAAAMQADLSPALAAANRTEPGPQ